MPPEKPNTLDHLFGTEAELEAESERARQRNAEEQSDVEPVAEAPEGTE